MDAKITKSRLANFLAYDWLKILVAVGLVVAALCVFFTTVATRPRTDQTFELYAYTGLRGGVDSANFEKNALGKDCFSYDILEAQFEAFDQFDMYAQTAYVARRAAKQGKAVFISGQDYEMTEGTETVVKNHLEDFIVDGITDYGEPTEYCNPYIELPAMAKECEAYLAKVFGAQWEQNDVPDDAAVREIFLARNGKDKRFRTSAQKEAGVALERARLVKLRTDYLAVREACASGLFSYTPYTSPAGKTYTVALNIGKITRLSEIVYYDAEDETGKTVRRADDIHLVAFYNGSDSTDLRFEFYSLVHWLMQRYGS